MDGQWRGRDGSGEQRRRGWGEEQRSRQTGSTQFFLTRTATTTTAAAFACCSFSQDAVSILITVMIMSPIVGELVVVVNFVHRAAAGEVKGERERHTKSYTHTLYKGAGGEDVRQAA